MAIDLKSLRALLAGADITMPMDARAAFQLDAPCVTEQMRANARLVAGAVNALPELLDRLESAEGRLGHMNPFMRHDDPEGSYECIGCGCTNYPDQDDHAETCPWRGWEWKR